ncbi:MarR family winged helix-turn-helix transcriptional regulator [Zooshikella harenae]|uniref:Winged helix-turn-helix transcriptional regulator n=1 Tax=Zooshikella harenae TaxID=2827238 RepID=A0ABS5ZCS9_9GAMM|nr:MarR family winged helix-turn-helix transcriptional regulator [Zooshikella harenae]MBU2711075.1 winged helix-turn-helix transcriptional regulator [Zooshikella harenae]
MALEQQESLGFLLADISRLMRQTYQRIEGCGLTLAQARLLLYVARFEGVRQIDLAEMLEVKPITLARLVDQLAEFDLVERRPDPKDRRAHQIFLRPAASDHLTKIRQFGAEVQSEALAGLNQEQVATLFFALKTMRENLCSRS